MSRPQSTQKHTQETLNHAPDIPLPVPETHKAPPPPHTHAHQCTGMLRASAMSSPHRAPLIRSTRPPGAAAAAAEGAMLLWQRTPWMLRCGERQQQQAGCDESVAYGSVAYGSVRACGWDARVREVLAWCAVHTHTHPHPAAATHFCYCHRENESNLAGDESYCLYTLQLLWCSRRLLAWLGRKKQSRCNP